MTHHTTAASRRLAAGGKHEEGGEGSGGLGVTDCTADGTLVGRCAAIG